ncbi:hypothetical protein [Aminobacter sp. MDW-2]|uniref:hypothetical protein n=1 Tax=Aminobacter sp. MDW-2 TaxID=2666139 RepID=UPI0012B03C60|nr:hypothetical protein [Aminobacter sp. MDW-2]MRX32786.1 hypothetical protein [Aminobacter sp. MDW-2]QNH34552.1 hypothetical protein H5P29_00945 [Aminobacter sp. MDW-2]
MTITANNIIEALIASSSAKIWAKELAFFGGDSRIDFWTLEPTASQQFRATAYEVKISRADFKRDNITKQGGALRWSDRFWYVTPPGILSKADLPPWAGLMEWDGTFFTIIRRAPKRSKAEPDWAFVVSLMRNCGDSRRDVEILKQEAAFWKNRAATQERLQRLNQTMEFERWKKRHAPKEPAQ